MNTAETMEYTVLQIPFIIFNLFKTCFLYPRLVFYRSYHNLSSYVEDDRFLTYLFMLETSSRLIEVMILHNKINSSKYPDEAILEALMNTFEKVEFVESCVSYEEKKDFKRTWIRFVADQLRYADKTTLAENIEGMSALM